MRANLRWGWPCNSPTTFRESNSQKETGRPIGSKQASACALVASIPFLKMTARSLNKKFIKDCVRVKAVCHHQQPIAIITVPDDNMEEMLVSSGGSG